MKLFKSDQRTLGFLCIGLLFLILACGDSPPKSSVDLLFEKAVQLHNKGDFDEAMEVYQLVINESPRLAKAYHHRGLLFASQNDLKSAIKDLTSAIEKKSKFGSTIFG